MRRRVLVTTMLAGALLASGLAPRAASAAPPPLTGSVSCALDAASTFAPAIGYGPGKTGRRLRPNADSKWKLTGSLSGCTGSQSGGHPRRPGPIVSGEVQVKGRADGHTCAAMTANGMTIPSMKLRWFDAQGELVSTTNATGTATAHGLFNGTPYESNSPPVFWPDYSPPGIISFTVDAVAKANSKAFPGDSLSLTVVADETMADFTFPCSFTYPPVGLGLPAFGHHGENGPSALAVS
jgi:hypothetical protein